MMDRIDSTNLGSTSVETSTMCTEFENIPDSNNLGSNSVETPTKCKEFENIPPCDEGLKPIVGRLYDSVKEFESSYKDYAHAVGFSVRSWSARTDSNDVLQYKYFVCSKQGYKKDELNLSNMEKGKGVCRKRANLRCRCNAQAVVKRTLEGKYVVSTFYEGHNHDLCTPSKKQFLRSNRKLKDVHKHVICSLDRVNVGVTKAFHIIKEQVGGFENIGCTLKDAQNFSRELKTLIQDSDAQIFIQNFKMQQNKHPAFYYAYELDEESHLKSVFWADGIARRNYSMFGELVSFDTTYRTNKYSMIFAPFTGINHHRLSINFGAAFLSNETIESFSWLFSKFVDCMSTEPELIVTDQDPAMTSAIRKTFKSTKHRYCMWHILKKVSEKVGGNIMCDEKFHSKLKSCVWKSETADEFESSWYSLISDFKLESNDWLTHVFNIRSMWIPAYFRDIPLFGLLRTTSRSESENSFFNTFVNNKLGLVEFYSRFENAIDYQRHKELKANYDTLNGHPMLKTSLGLEKHASQIYTHKIFYIFQEELWASCMTCGVRKVNMVDVDDDHGSKIFTIYDSEYPLHCLREVFISNSIISCSCKMYEGQGIICRHVITVLRGQGVNDLPTHCILQRWTKITSTRPIYDMDVDQFCDVSTTEQRRRVIANVWNNLTCCMEIAKDNDEALAELANAASNWRNQLCQNAMIGQYSNTVQYFDSEIPNQIDILPPLLSKTKGRGKRIKSGIEISIEKLQKATRICKSCGQLAMHDSRNCPKKKS